MTNDQAALLAAASWDREDAYGSDREVTVLRRAERWASWLDERDRKRADQATRDANKPQPGDPPRRRWLPPGEPL